MVETVNLNGNGSANGSTSRKIFRVGIIGCGEIAQVAHIPTLNFLSDYFLITYLCDVSSKALAHCATKVAGKRPQTTTSAEELCASPDVDVVVVCNATAFHPIHAILALQNNKHVLVEKPLALGFRDIDALEAAEKVSKGSIFVGYMRRYAPAFLDAIAEIGGKMSEIQYVRVRDIIGPNSIFVNQSGTFPKRFTDFSNEDSEELAAKDRDMTEGALISDYGVPVNAETKRMLALLGGLGSHDLSAMRELLGMPRAVIGASLGFPFWSAILQYDSFQVTYESGINSIPLFDAHIEVYTAEKSIRVTFDSPYIKGLPTTMSVREAATGPRGEPCYQERMVRTTYEDAYTVEFKEWYDCIINGRQPKTSVGDARKDLEIFKMLMQSAFEQGAKKYSDSNINKDFDDDANTSKETV